MAKTPVRYDEVADFYESFAPDLYEDPPTAALLRFAGDVSGLDLLDLACGHGRLTRELARRGANVVGLDISGALLEKARAREKETPLGIVYVQADATLPGTLEGQRFDGVICSFGLMDIDDLEGAVATVVRVLRSGGFFVFSILHPCFPGSPARQARPSWPPGRGYYDEGWWIAEGRANGIRPKVGANHRMLSSYLNTLLRAGLLIDQVAEPRPTPEWIEATAGEDQVPLYFVGKLRLPPRECGIS